MGLGVSCLAMKIAVVMELDQFMLASSALNIFKEDLHHKMWFYIHCHNFTMHA